MLARLNETVIDVVGEQLFCCLPYNFPRMSQNQHPLACGNGLLDDRNCDVRLAGAGRRHDDHLPLAGRDRVVPLRNDFVLIVARLGHATLRAFANAAASVA